MRRIIDLSALALVSLSLTWFSLSIHYYLCLTEELFRYRPAAYIAVESWLLTSILALTVTVIAFITLMAWLRSIPTQPKEEANS